MLEKREGKIEGKMEAKIELNYQRSIKKAVVQKKQQICWRPQTLINKSMM